ncbi:hypothetical protein EVAR_73591_1 [Eumeta japonica]|uniref:Uncharacterized protein n=1 Tax=Eumeta variegata TaxID=151549 RepID=A0A4C1SB38_EUMVA|nr:hypothetical protein EVAR_73591_1 [Eumeta japonica]
MSVPRSDLETNKSVNFCRTHTTRSTSRRQVEPSVQELSHHHQELDSEHYQSSFRSGPAWCSQGPSSAILYKKKTWKDSGRVPLFKISLIYGDADASRPAGRLTAGLMRFFR